MTRAFVPKPAKQSIDVSIRGQPAEVEQDAKIIISNRYQLVYCGTPAAARERYP